MKRLLLAAALLALAAAPASTARADILYGFARQTISNFSIGPTVNFGTATTASQDSALVNGSGLSDSSTLDAPQAFVGGTPPAPQNFFLPYALGVSPTTPQTFSRGDSLIASASLPGDSFSVVAESFLNTTSPPGGVTAAGNGSASFSVPFTVPSSTSEVISYNFLNHIVASTSGAGTASAAYHFDITIRDAGGNLVFNSSTAVTNLAVMAPPNGPEVIQSGVEAVTTPVLSPGTTYTLALSLSANSSVNAGAAPAATSAGVPEPSTLALLALGGALAGWRRWRKRRA